VVAAVAVLGAWIASVPAGAAPSAPPDLPEARTADGLPVGSVNIKENPSGKVHWSFGAVTGYHDFSGSDLKPYIVTHSFGEMVICSQRGGTGAGVR
jgi:hypothetical protein